MTLSATHLVFIFLALAVSLAPGFLAARRIKSAADYSVGGRRSGTGLVAGSLLGTIIGGASTVGTAQLGFRLGLTAWWFTLGCGIALLIMAAFYARPLRQSGLTTVSEFLVPNFGPKAGLLTSAASSIGIFFSIVASTLSGLHMIADVFGLGLPAAGTVLVLVTAAFVFFGGIRGGGMAGLMKLALILCSIVVGGAIAFGDITGAAGAAAPLPSFPWFSMFGRGAEDALFSLAAVVTGVLSTQSYLQAVFSARDPRTAAAGCIAAAAVVIPVGLPSVFIGMFMHVHHPGITAISALPMFLLTYLPDWLGGIGIGALLLSVIGSIGGLSLATGTLITRDIAGSLWRNMSDRQCLLANRLLVVASMLAALAFVFLHLDASVLDYNYLSMALRACGVFLPLTFCIFLKGRVAPCWGVLSIAAGMLAAIAWPWLVPSSHGSLFPALAANLAFLLAGLAAGRRRGRAAEGKA